MTGRAPGGRLGERIAAVLRSGTLVAVAAVTAGYLLTLVGGDDGPGTRPLLEVLGGRDADALIAAGLLGLTLLPLGVVGTAAVTFGGSGERRYVVSSLVTLALLVIGLAAAALLAAPS
jgi:hypothetical protein